ncbi:MAG TPA: FAD-dependent oxidoreductase [Usitatibacter sp.]|nr:FAD-dependent oxidoreductase [Usitatibacter sp.]
MDITVIGGGYAGLSCALRLAWRARKQGTPARIRLLNPRSVLVERIRLHQASAGQRLRPRRIDDLLRRCGVELVAGKVEAVDRAARTIQVDGASMHWDRLVLAMGSRIARSDVPGAAEHTLAPEPDTAGAVHNRFRSLQPGSHVAVVGGGLTAIESAGEIAEAFPHLRVHLVSREPVASGFGTRARRHVLDALGRKLGVDVHEGVSVRSVSATRLETSGGPIAFDACLWAAGFEPPPLPRQLEVALDARGRALVDGALRSLSDEAIYAVGDIASFRAPPGQCVPMGCKSAMPMGAHAAENLARELRGDAPAPFDYALLFYCVSLGRRDGLVQWADDEGNLTGRMLTGWRAALFKEAICRSTWWALKIEARGHRGVVWKRSGRATATVGLHDRQSA